MPRMAVDKRYRFDRPPGPVSLLDLFEGRRQLILYRFFLEPGAAGWPERGCVGCSFLAAQVAHLAHLHAPDTTLSFLSRAAQPDIERMGSAWSYLDPTALSRREEWEESPPGYPQTPPYGWWRLHDEYGDGV